ncbi:maltase 2 [Caerostris darwini]|uniref:Maltase 2 n=1 Tax=Caerostris darwini TaxID=1538125 RepID=A0AAV4SF22_9ARAC|nr:maltase 2 [Caerostris darwini]
MSTLPALDDLHSKARGLTLDLRLHPQVNPPHLVTPSSAMPEQESRCSFGLLKNCTTVFQCNKFKSDMPTYKPLSKKQLSTPPSVLRQWSERSRFCMLFVSIILSTVGFWVGVVLWNTKPVSKADDPDPRDQWHRDAIFYEIFPASFMDTDSDGYGDFEGIIQKLGYVRDLGVTAIRLNSIFSALDYPLEYEHIIDLHNPDPHLGRMDDFRTLVEAAHEKGLKVVLDLNPTITSDQHTWALHWQRGIPGYEHFYASANRSKVRNCDSADTELIVPIP